MAEYHDPDVRFFGMDKKRVPLTRARSGVLKDHGQKCDNCSGTGIVRSDDPDDPLAVEQCDICDGDGNIWWPCWFENDITECSHCHQEKQCSNISPTEPEGQYVCFECYIELHRQQCGCRLWEEYEDAQAT